MFYVNVLLLFFSLGLWSLDYIPSATILSFFILLLLGLNAYIFSNKFVCLVRLFIFSLPALIFAVLHLIYGYNVLLSSFAIAYSTPELRDKAFLFLLISLLSSIIGLSLTPRFSGRYLFGSIYNIVLLLPSRLSLLFVLVYSFVVVYGYGGFISQSNIYGSKSSAISQYFAVGQLLFYFFIAIAIVQDLLRFKLVRKITIFTCIFSLLICMSGGGRLDFGPQIIILLILLPYLQGFRFQSLKKLFLYGLSKNTAIYLFQLIFMLLIVLAILLFVGFSRFDALSSLLEKNPFLIELPTGSTYFFLDTFNSTIGGIFSVLVQDTLYPSYFGFLFNIPPLFLGLPRLLTAEYFITAYKGTVFTVGAVFEPTEAFLNLNILGLAIVPLIISSFYSWLQHLFDNALVSFKSIASSPSQLFYAVSSFVVILMFLLISPRGIWYQSFSLFRCLTFIIILNFIGMITTFRSP